MSNLFAQGTVRELATSSGVDAFIFEPIADEQAQLWARHWLPAKIRALDRLIREGTPPERLPENLHWDWRRKHFEAKSKPDCSSFFLQCGDIPQGFVMFLEGHRSLLNNNGKLIYVDYLESAPWNRSELYESPQYSGIGTLLMATVIQKSLDKGYNGRVGLHSLPRAEGFYRDRMQMEDLGLDPNEQNLRYFELTEARAAELLSGAHGA